MVLSLIEKKNREFSVKHGETGRWSMGGGGGGANINPKKTPIICSRRQFQILPLFKKKYLSGMIFHENRLLTDDSHEIS